MASMRRNPAIEHRISVAESDSDIDFWTEKAQKAFEPFVRRRSVLTEMPFIFRTELINILPIIEDPTLTQALLETVKMCRRAIYSDPDLAYAFQIEMFPAINNAELNWFSLALSTIPLGEDADLADRIGQNMSILHSIMEVGLEPRARYLYGFAHYLSTAKYPIPQISLGNCIAQWPKDISPRLQSLFFDPKFGLPVNQWRNIAAHRDFRRIGLDKFQATYGINRDRHIEFTHEDLDSVLTWSSEVHRVCRMAQTITNLEFMSELKKRGLPAPSIRFDQMLLSVSHNLRMVGFSYEYEQITEDMVRVWFRDDLGRPPRNALIHLSQALVSLASGVDSDLALRDTISKIAVTLLSPGGSEFGSATVSQSHVLRYLNKQSSMEQYVESIEFSIQS